MTHYQQPRFDFTDSDDAMIKLQTRRAVEDGEFLSADHAYESLWYAFENELEEQHKADAISKVEG